VAGLGAESFAMKARDATVKMRAAEVILTIAVARLCNHMTGAHIEMAVVGLGIERMSLIGSGARKKNVQPLRRMLSGAARSWRPSLEVLVVMKKMARKVALRGRRTQRKLRSS
jgi:hypothetical protein